ncbi:MAG: TauD/TfdA dioxygenase family protein [Steroidobacteraceae bacterium]
MPTIRRLNLPCGTEALPWGIEVSNIDLSRPLHTPAMLSVLIAFYQNQFLLVRGQQLSPEQFVAFCRWFGRPKPHLLDDLHLPGHPEILTLSNDIRDGKPTGLFEGTSFWHTDVAYEDLPKTSTIAYSILAPPEPVQLQVASMFLAYDALSQSMKTRIEGLSVRHHYGNRDDMHESSPRAAERHTGEQTKRIRDVYQPLVLTHPVTGRRALYAVTGSSCGIRGMPDDEALDLLNELEAHATRPEFIVSHSYEKGDVVAWDNLSTLHRTHSTRSTTASHDGRPFWRISVTGRDALFMNSRSDAGCRVS